MPAVPVAGNATQHLAKWVGTAAILASCNAAPVAAPGLAETVAAYDTAQGGWESARLSDLSPGRELRHQGQLYRVGESDVVWLGSPTEEALAHADAAFTEVDCPADPVDTDWVLVLADDEDAAHHARLWEVEDDSQVAYDGRVFLVVDDQLEATGDVLGRVVHTYQRQAPQVIDAVIAYPDGAQDTLTGTPNHPFWVPARGAFVPLGELEIGAALHVQDGGEALLVSKTWRQGDFTVFDVEVAGLHAFYVGEDNGVGAGVLVHNSSVPKPSAGLKPTQHNVSGPKVDRLVADMKQNGFDPASPVQVDGVHVVDGHHRVMAADKAGVDIVTTPGGSVPAGVKADAPADFSEVNVLDVDY